MYIVMQYSELTKTFYFQNDIQIYSTSAHVYDNDIFINCNWVVTRWQYTFTHKQYIEHK